ncbi:MAG: hypothetical protein KatS3mg102_0534 [Planctomycetota bacterium]|nr:MAG: hypothetical protein KatS3mg102_0534 [Planctomycetota bacterium]
MSTDITLSRLIEAGVHFGHRASRWNPRMAPYIYGKRNLIHIIDLRQTLRGLIRATAFLQKLCEQGGEALFVGTKRQAREIVRELALAAGAPYVCERWLGGTLTNFRTVMSRLKRLEELEALEQTGEIEQYSKKMVSSLRREKRKILRNLGGIRTLRKLPDAVVVVDPRTEYNCVREAKKLSIPVVAVVDTDSDPSDVDIVIPGNDDAFRAIRVILTPLAAAVKRGKDRHAEVLAEQRRLEEERRRREAERQEALRKAREAALAEKRREKEEREAAAAAADTAIGAAADPEGESAPVPVGESATAEPGEGEAQTEAAAPRAKGKKEPAAAAGASGESKE